MWEFKREFDLRSHKIAIISLAYAANNGFQVAATSTRQRHRQEDDGSPGRAQALKQHFFP